MLARRRGSPDFDALSGFVATIKYFASPMSRIAEPLPARPQHTFYSVIETALRNPELEGSHLKEVEGTIQLVDRLVENPADRIRRAAVYDHLDWSKPGHFNAWRIIVQAWNVAAQRTVCASGGSIGNMSHSGPIGAYVDQTADIMLKGVDEDLPKPSSLQPLVPEIPIEWDPGDLSWAELDQITSDERSGDARSNLQKALTIPGKEHIETAVMEFAETIAPLVKNKVKRPERWWIWALGGVLIRFGGPAAPMLGVALFAGQAAERGMFWAVRRFGERMMAARILETAKQIGIPPADTG